MAAKNTQYLPEEICMDILERLPVKSLYRFKAVCKPWKSLVSSPSFIDRQYDRSAANCSKLAVVEERCSKSKKCSILLHTLNSNPKSPVETTTTELPTNQDNYYWSCWCRGLLLVKVISIGSAYDLLLWNPSTNECKEVPKPVPYSSMVGEFAIGYDFTIRSHKIVTICRGVPSCFNYQIAVYTCKINSWTFYQSGDFLGIGMAFINPITLNNGAPHWLVKHYNDDEHWRVNDDDDNVNVNVNDGDDDINYDSDDFKSFYYTIEYFDFTTNELMVVPQPDEYAYRAYGLVHPDLYDMEGLLCIGYYTERGAIVKDVEIWVMIEYGVKESWSRLMKFDVFIDNLNIYRFPLCFTKNDVKVSLVRVWGRKSQRCLALYNGKERRAELRIPNQLWKDVRAFAFVESLISV
ncbi:hypothetical protein COLO4_21637 [Corchorus olitorius]|uniref:F-box domain-containing protein n=1 Tax=Corchorus olitorius TaxID=93759 RepID=A0A1R3IS36_9ROSI|nr:hypothetical protein COLO4_21637 [Corchorus olitorius]